jgi:hypothetical protein
MAQAKKGPMEAGIQWRRMPKRRRPKKNPSFDACRPPALPRGRSPTARARGTRATNGRRRRVKGG